MVDADQFNIISCQKLENNLRGSLLKVVERFASLENVIIEFLAKNSINLFAGQYTSIQYRSIYI